MIRFLLRAVIAALGLWVATRWVPGLRINDAATLLLAGVLLGIVNAIVRPLAVLLTLPLTLLTLGLFLFVINALMFWAAASLLKGFQDESFGAALLGSLIYSIASTIIDVAIEHLFD